MSRPVLYITLYLVAELAIMLLAINERWLWVEVISLALVAGAPHVRRVAMELTK